MMETKKEVTLSNGHRMPIVGLGMWQTEDQESVSKALKAAIAADYRHIDTAFVYKNEKFIGSALQEIFQAGVVKREDLFIVTKLPTNGLHSGVVEEFFKKSLKDLQLDYLDLYLIHFPVATKPSKDEYEPLEPVDGEIPVDTTVDLVETWKVMESLVDRGLVKSIGLSNFNSQQVQRIYDNARIKPAILQVECHAYLPQYELVEFCKNLNISVTAYSPLGSPGLADFARRKFNVESNFPNLLKDEALVPLVKKHNKTAAQILLRYLIQRDIIIIPKSITPHRIEENINIFDFTLDKDDMDLLKSLSSKKFRYFDFKLSEKFLNHPEYPFKIPF